MAPMPLLGLDFMRISAPTPYEIISVSLLLAALSGLPGEPNSPSFRGIPGGEAPGAPVAF
jgi:hypothetical protein